MNRLGVEFGGEVTLVRFGLENYKGQRLRVHIQDAITIDKCYAYKDAITLGGLISVNIGNQIYRNIKSNSKQQHM